MKALRTFSILILTLLGSGAVHAQTTDSVDAVDYDVAVDLSSGNSLQGYADVTLRLLRPCTAVGLDMICTVDSVRVQGVPVSATSLAALPTAGIAAGQDFHVEVWYHSSGYVESGGWGGMHFENNQSYNLGVGFAADPHVMGRALFPCRDNFTDKATYTLRVTTKAGWTAECGGMRQSVATDTLGREHSVWRISQPTPTYLVSVGQAAWERIEDTVASLYGDYPLTIGYRQRNEQNVRAAFAQLDTVVPMYEHCFGPYRWGRIGYIATSKGSMEHVNNIALDQDFVASTSERAQTTIAHELGHAWFGNLVTCATEGDMWINEGGASFCSEVAMEAALGREASDDYYQRWLESVLRTTHITDGGYRPLHGMPHQYTYGSTTYDKGWMVWHSLRGYLGEEVFYNAIQRLMNSCAFGNIDAYRLRDSLSLYSGVDLTDFFDFHVFGPGFVDYHVDLIPGDHPAVNIRQQATGTTATPRGSLVPVTFFGTDGTSMKGYFQEGTSTLDVPYDVAFCVLDRDCEFSDAAILGVLKLTDYVGLQTLPTAHLRVRMDQTIQTQNLYAEHHMAPAMGEMPGGVVRRANRYWMLRGTWTESDSLKGYFRFVRGTFSSSYPNLDRDFYTKAATADSLGLFYRVNGDDSWHLISRLREGDANEGWLVAENILPGEYTLAVVDFENLAIESSEFGARSSEMNLFPNPLGKGQPLTLEVETEMPFSVTITDSAGRLVWHRDGCRNGQRIDPQLPKGSYLVKIENKQISLQSKLIQL